MFFLFHLKSSFRSQDIQVFALTFLVMYKSRLIRKIMLILKVMTSQTDSQTIPVYILLNISRRKGKQTMKLDQLIEYTMRNIFVEKSCTKCAKQIILRSLSKKTKLSISLDRLCKILNSLFLFYANLSAIEMQ